MLYVITYEEQIKNDIMLMYLIFMRPTKMLKMVH